MFTTNAGAQCTNTVAFGSVAAPGAGNCVSYGTTNLREYNTVTSAVAGETYVSTHPYTAYRPYITVRSGTSNGPVVAHGYSPLMWTAAVSGSHFVHYNTNNTCGTSTATAVNLATRITGVATTTSCSGNFYDVGGSSSNYGNSRTDVWVFYPATAGSKVRVTFSAFDTEGSYDGLQIFNGNSNLSPMISSGAGVGSNAATCPAGAYSGTTSPGVVTSTAADGSLTFVFMSDGATNRAGWSATVSCFTPCTPSVSAPGFGTNEWNILGYNGNNLDLTGTSFRGYYTDTRLNYNTGDRWDTGTTPSNANNTHGLSWQGGCTVDDDYHTVVAKRQGFPAGYYQLDIPAHDDDIRVYVNGTQVLNYVGCCGPRSKIWCGELGPSSTIEVRQLDILGGSYQSMDFTLLSNINLDWGDGASKQWLVHGINTNNTYSTYEYRGKYDFNANSTNEGLINTETFWSALRAPSDAGTTIDNGNKWSGCAMNTDYFRIAHRRRNFPCGFYRILMQLSDDGSELYVDGVLRWSGTNYKNAGGQTCGTGCNTLVGYFYLDANSTVEIRTMDATSDAYLKVDILPVTSGITYNGGTTDNTSQTWCVGNNATTMNNSTTPSVTIAGQTAIIPSGVWTYQWQSNTSSCSGTWANISGQTGTSLNPGIVNQTTYYRRNAFLPCSGTILASTPCATITTPVPNTSLSANNRTATCTVSGSNWIHFYDATDNRLVVSINPNGNNLGNVTATSYVDPGAVLVQACGTSNPMYTTASLGRRWVVTPQFQPSSAVSIKLPFSDAEFSTLQTAATNTTLNPFDNVSNIGQLKLSKYSGANQNGSAADNCTQAGGSGGTTLIPAQAGNGAISTANGFVNAISGGSYIQFSINGFSEFWLHNSSNPSALPVSLTQFSALCNDQQHIEISWSTASELNAQKYIVQKSRDMQHWIAVDELQAAGNSNVELNYSSTDPNPYALSYYRLVQVDNDGQENMYGPVSATCGTIRNDVSVFPNPSQGKFTFNVSSTEDLPEAIISICDLTGKIVSRRTMHIHEGMSQFPYDMPDLNQGAYFIRIENPGDTFLPVKFIVQQ